MNDASLNALSEWQLLGQEGVPEHIEKYGVSGIEEFLKAKLGKWKNMEINIGVTGDSGAGKSSFINVIRDLKDVDEGAAKTGVTETTREVAVYPHPTNNKIKFWDLPGIGTPSNPTLKSYCEKVELEKYNCFLIFAAKRFTENDRLLAEKVKSLDKSFFFIRTHIDENYRSEKRNTGFNEEAMLNEIKQDCLKNLKGFGVDKNVFLISNHDPDKWDFDRLTQAILDGLPLRLKESLTLSFNLLTTHSKDLLKRKVEILRGRIWLVALASGAGALVPVPGLSVAVDLALLTQEFNIYKSQLGLPEKNSSQLQRMTTEDQAKVAKFCVTSAVQILNLLATYSTSSTVEEATRYFPLAGVPIAVGISSAFTYHFLHHCLNQLEKTAMAFLDMMSTRVVGDSRRQDSN